MTDDNKKQTLRDVEEKIIEELKYKDIPTHDFDNSQKDSSGKIIRSRTYWNVPFDCKEKVIRLVFQKLKSELSCEEPSLRMGKGSKKRGMTMKGFNSILCSICQDYFDNEHDFVNHLKRRHNWDISTKEND